MEQEAVESLVASLVVAYHTVDSFVAYHTAVVEEKMEIGSSLVVASLVVAYHTADSFVAYQKAVVASLIEEIVIEELLALKGRD